MGQPFPVLFVSHGAPTFAVEPGLAGAALNSLGKELPTPHAVVILSPHWRSNRSIRVTGHAQPETVHDFGGFPDALYRLRYPAPGAPDLAASIVGTLSASGWEAEINQRRGRDHGAWVPLLHLLPSANVPVVQLSMPASMDPVSALRLGQALESLRSEDILIVASGSLTHNLYEFRGSGPDAAPYVEGFATWTASALARQDTDALINYRKEAPDAVRAHPTDEHFLPLFIALGAAGSDYQLRVLEGGVVHGVLSMDSYMFSNP